MVSSKLYILKKEAIPTTLEMLDLASFFMLMKGKVKVFCEENIYV